MRRGGPHEVQAIRMRGIRRAAQEHEEIKRDSSTCPDCRMNVGVHEMYGKCPVVVMPRLGMSR